MSAEGSARLGGLDGLRGCAAAVVLLHHALLASPGLANVYRGSPGHLSTAVKVFAYSPLHLVWAGGEAVLVFFVLSGFVLSRSFLKQPRPAWTDYYPRRVLRLYLPVLAALVLAFPQARWLRPSSPDAKASWVYNAHLGSGSVHNLVRDATLYHEQARISFIDGPIWSLHWEVLFSLLLPIYLVVLVLRHRLLGAAAAVVLIGISAAGIWKSMDAVTYLPVFGLGVLAATHADELGALARRHSRLLLVAGALLLTAQWDALGVRHLSPSEQGAAFAATLVGAALVTLAFLDGSVAEWAREAAVVRWLGKRSFSLYLTHAPLIISVSYLVGGHPPVLVVLVISVPLSLLVAEVFGRVVEEPAHQLSRRAGRWAMGSLRPQPAEA